MYPSQQNATDQTANLFWLIAFICLALIVGWFFAKSYILLGVFAVRHYELLLVQWVVSGVNIALHFLHLPMINQQKLNALQKFMETVNYKKVYFADVISISKFMGYYYRFPVVAILLSLAWYIYFKHSTTHFRQTYNMQSLKKLECTNWPQIRPVASLDLLKQDLDKGAWAMAKLPLDFCKENELLTVTEKYGKKVWGIDNIRAERLFVLQVGPLWAGLDRVPMHTKALAVIFISKALREHSLSVNFLDQLSDSAKSRKLDFSGINEAVEKYKNHHLFAWLARRHAYVYTLMASLLEIARTDGVLATSEFLWLKFFDRRLWYVLNSIGRQTCVVEAAGPFAHWKAEKKFKRPLRAPMVKQAVIALEAAVNDILYTTAEDKWHTSNAA